MSAVVLHADTEGPFVRAGFTTRHGGVRSGASESLDLGVRSAHLTANLDLALAALHPGWSSSDAVLLDQVHGNEIVEATRAVGPDAVIGAADGVWTAHPDVVLVVRTADCVPVLVEADGRVGAAHAGWRGIASEVLPRLLDAMRAAGSTRFRVTIGPHIGADIYETGAEVVDQITKSGVPRRLLVRPDPLRVDLGAALRWQASNWGVDEVGSVGGCTSGPDFFSYRRDGGVTGRQAGLIGLLS